MVTDRTSQSVSDDVLEFLGLTRRELEAMPPADSEDIARASMAAFLNDGSSTARLALHSEGTLHVAGDGVHEHAAPIRDLGEFLTGWQKLVTACGAALEGDKGLRGRIASGVAAKTQLVLDAAMQPGSVVIPVRPASDAVQEIHGDDVPLIDSGERPLADRSVGTVMSLLAEAPGTDADGLRELLSSSGPRVASNFKQLLDSLSRARCDLDATWRENGQPTLRSHISAKEAGDVRDLIDRAALDHDEITLVGVLRTVSDVNNLRLSVRDDNEDERQVSIQRGQLSEEVIRSLNVSQSVKIVCDVTTTERPGGGSVETYTAIRLLL